MANQSIRIRLKAYDHDLIDKSTDKIIRTARSTGALISGPIPLPTDRSVYTVLRSPHVDKKSREHFEMRIHKRMLDISEYNNETIEELQKLDLPAGIEVEIQAFGAGGE